jgi:hypothetical protein
MVVKDCKSLEQLNTHKAGSKASSFVYRIAWQKPAVRGIGVMGVWRGPVRYCIDPPYSITSFPRQSLF